MHLTNPLIVKLLAGCSLFRLAVAQAEVSRDHARQFKRVAPEIIDELVPRSTAAALAARSTPTQSFNGLSAGNTAYIDPHSVQADFNLPPINWAQRYHGVAVPPRDSLCIPVNHYTVNKGVLLDLTQAGVQEQLGAICEDRCNFDPQCQSFVAVSEGEVRSSKKAWGECYFFKDTFVFPAECDDLPRFYSAYAKPGYQPPVSTTNDSSRDPPVIQEKCWIPPPACANPNGPTTFVEQPCFPKHHVGIPPNHYYNIELPGIDQPRDQPLEPRLSEDCQMLCNKHSRCQAVVGTVTWAVTGHPFSHCYLYDRPQLFPRTCTNCEESFVVVAYSKQKTCPPPMVTIEANITLAAATSMSTRSTSTPNSFSSVITITTTTSSLPTSTTSASSTTSSSSTTESSTTTSTTTGSTSSTSTSSTSNASSTGMLHDGTSYALPASGFNVTITFNNPSA